MYLRACVSASEDLQEEVSSGKCHLSMSDDGECRRVVRLVALELQNQDPSIPSLNVRRLQTSGRDFTRYR